MAYPDTVTREERQIPPGDPGILETLEVMREFARSASGNPLIRRTAAEVLRRGPLFFRGWLEERFRYVDDPPGVELVRDPVILARAIARCEYAEGDCDDVSTYAAAVGLAAGFRARFVVVAFGPWTFEHVWTEIHDGARWWEMDVTRPREMPVGSAVVREIQLEV